MYSDNKRLCDILNKERLTTTDMTQDAAVLVKEIDDICKEVTFEITLTHVLMENELVSFFDNPKMFLIQRCHMESQNERTRMEMSTEKISLPQTNVTINKSVHAFIRTMDEQQHGKKMIENKFKEYAPFIDYEARGVFKRATPSILKCCYGFNHHGKRDKMLNRYSSDRCISCGALEDWLHVLRCPSTIKLRDKWLHTIKKELQRKIKNQVILNDAYRFVEDIYSYLNGSTNVPGSQNIIGFNSLFQGFVVKDWFGANSDETKYHQSNKIIIKYCVHLYHDCWLQRNKLMQEDKNLKQRLVEEI